MIAALTAAISKVLPSVGVAPSVDIGSPGCSVPVTMKHATANEKTVLVPATTMAVVQNARTTQRTNVILTCCRSCISIQAWCSRRRRRSSTFFSFDNRNEAQLLEHAVGKRWLQCFFQVRRRNRPCRFQLETESTRRDLGTNANGENVLPQRTQVHLIVFRNREVAVLSKFHDESEDQSFFPSSVLMKLMSPFTNL